MARGQGTIFVELDIDATKFVSMDSEIRRRGGETAVSVETAWRALGSKSAMVFDLQRQAAEKAFDFIKRSALSTSQDIVRAEQLKNQTLQNLNKEMIGSAGGVQSAFSQMFGAFTLANVAAMEIRKLAYEVKQFFVDGFNAVENFRVSTASLASTITTFAKGSQSDLPGTYKLAYEYASALVYKLEEWDAKTLATGEDLRAMVETMAQSGVVLDINNKKQEEGFIAISNAVALLTQGQNHLVQFRQEIRGLMDGSIRDTNRLAVLLDKVVGGNLDANLKKWKEEGTLIENTGALLKGFAAGQKDIENTWLAVKSTLETMYHRVLRGMFEPMYNDIIGWGKEISLNIMEQKDQTDSLANNLKTGMYKGWEDIKNIVQTTLNLMQPLIDSLGVLGRLTGVILDGWGYIFAAVSAFSEKMAGTYDAIKNLFKTGDIVNFHKTMLENNKDTAEKMIQNMEKYQQKLAGKDVSNAKVPEMNKGGIDDESMKKAFKSMGDSAKDTYNLIVKEAQFAAEEQRRSGEYEKTVFESLWNKKRDAAIDYYNISAENIQKNIKGETEKTDAMKKLDNEYSMQLEKDMAERSKNWDSFGDKKLTIEANLNKTINSLSTQSHEKEVDLLVKKYEEYGRYINDKKLLEEGFNAELNSLMQKQLSDMKSFYAGYDEGIQKERTALNAIIELKRKEYEIIYGKVEADKWANDQILDADLKMWEKRLSNAEKFTSAMVSLADGLMEMQDRRNRAELKAFEKQQKEGKKTFDQTQKELQKEENTRASDFAKEQERRQREFEDQGKHTQAQITAFNREQQDRVTAFNTEKGIRDETNAQAQQDFADKQAREDEAKRAELSRATDLFYFQKRAMEAQAIVQTALAVMSTLGFFGGTPWGWAAAGMVAAAGAVQIANIEAQQPPSYDSGGISNAKGIYQTGDIQEAHVPIPNGSIPVVITNNNTTNSSNNEFRPVIQVFIDSREIKAMIKYDSTHGGTKFINKRSLI